MMRFRSLGSGSSGNATVVEAGQGADTTRLLIDCGFGIRQLDARLARAGLKASELHAIFITHEHGDHIGCAQTLALRERIPIWSSAGTATSLNGCDIIPLLRQARDGHAFQVRGLQIEPFTVPHDALEPLQLTCTDGNRRLGVLTDLGHATPHVLQSLAHCHALLLECNHDEDLLAQSVYPSFLKQRVGGRHGHLSNRAACAVLQAVRHPGLNQVVAAHLSEQNNRPHLARAGLAQVLACEPEHIAVASAEAGTAWHEV